MKVQHLIVDTNAFVKNLPLHELGENIYTTREVVAEIRDGATRRLLEVLPYELQYREPLSEYIQLVTKLSKSTGDYASLSAVDIQLIALAYQISKEILGPEQAATQLKTELDAESLKKITVMGGQGGAQNKKVSDENDQEAQPAPTSCNVDKEVKEESTAKNASENENSSAENDDSGNSSSESENGDDGDDEQDLEDDDDDETGWITPSNYKQKIKEMNAANGEFEDESENSPVACLTNDFSMQNLMMHIGIKVLSSNGMLIKQLRTYILRCYTCFQTTSKMEKIFCPKCGHKTLKRVSVTVNPDGTQVIHLSRRVKLTGRGKKYSLPTPQGGKHANNPILSEDQPIPQQRPSKQALQRINPLNFPYVTGSSPFVTKDVYSRAAMLGINYGFGGGKSYWEKKNPNEAKKGGKKKKSRP